jgi:hypothetical protein
MVGVVYSLGESTVPLTYSEVFLLFDYENTLALDYRNLLHLAQRLSVTFPRCLTSFHLINARIRAVAIEHLEATMPSL